MTPQEITNILIQQGWKITPRGNLEKTSKRQGLDRTLRIKFQSISCLVQVKVEHPETPYQKRSTSWARIDSEYYRNIVLAEDGRIKIGRKLVGLTQPQ